MAAATLKPGRRPGRQRGASLVEFAVLSPLLIGLIAGVVDFGKAFYDYNALHKGVRDAARYLSSHVPLSDHGTVATYTTQAQNLVVYGNPYGTGAKLLPEFGNHGGDSVTVTPITGTPDITVTATYEYPFLLGALLNFLAGSSNYGPTVTLRASAVMPLLPTSS